MSTFNLYTNKETPTFETVWNILSEIPHNNINDGSFLPKATEALHILMDGQDTAYEGAFMISGFGAWVMETIMTQDNSMNTLETLRMIPVAIINLRNKSIETQANRS